MTRVLHVAPSIARQYGGPSEVLHGLLTAQRALGDEATLIVTDKGLTRAERKALGPETTVCRALPPYRWSFSPGIVAALLRALPRADIVHVHSVDTFTTSVTLLMSVLMRKPVVLQPHGAWDDYARTRNAPLKRWYARVVDGPWLRRISGVIVSSEFEADCARALSSRPIFTVPLGVPYELFTDPIPSASRDGDVLFLGRIARKKRVDLVLKAANLRPEVTFTIAGPLAPDLGWDPHAVVAESRLQNVTLTGPADARARADLLASHRLFLLPSDDESFGMAAAEAMAAGCVVLTSAHVPIAVSAEAEGAAVLVRQDEADIARTLRELLDDEGGLATIAAAARRFATRNCTWEHAAERSRSAYHSVTDGGGPS